MKKYLGYLLLGGLLAASVARATPPAFNLTIDVTNPNAVVITANDATALSDATATVNYNAGISLINFLPSVQSIPLGPDSTGLTFTGTLTGGGAGVPYDGLVTFNYGNAAAVPGQDLSIYNLEADGSVEQSFTTGATAFTGSATIDFGSIILPAAGTTGAIYIGFDSTHGGQIGTWNVISTTPVPEPGTYALIAGAAALGVVFMRRRKAAK